MTCQAGFDAKASKTSSSREEARPEVMKTPPGDVNLSAYPGAARATITGERILAVTTGKGAAVKPDRGSSRFVMYRLN